MVNRIPIEVRTDGNFELVVGKPKFALGSELRVLRKCCDDEREYIVTVKIAVLEVRVAVNPSAIKAWSPTWAYHVEIQTPVERRGEELRDMPEGCLEAK